MPYCTECVLFWGSESVACEREIEREILTYGRGFREIWRRTDMREEREWNIG